MALHRHMDGQVAPDSCHLMRLQTYNDVADDAPPPMVAPAERAAFNELEKALLSVAPAPWRSRL